MANETIQIRIINDFIDKLKTNSLFNKNEIEQIESIINSFNNTETMVNELYEVIGGK